MFQSIPKKAGNILIWYINHFLISRFLWDIAKKLVVRDQFTLLPMSCAPFPFPLTISYESYDFNSFLCSQCEKGWKYAFLEFARSLSVTFTVTGSADCCCWRWQRQWATICCLPSTAIIPPHCIILLGGKEVGIRHWTHAFRFILFVCKFSDQTNWNHQFKL